MRKNILIISAVFAALLFACGCKGKDDLKTTVTSVKTDPAQMTLKVGDSKQISVSWTPAEIKATPSFSSNKESVATVNDKGLVTAVAEGAANIIVKVGEQTAICKVTVSNSGITEVSVQPESVVLMVGNTESLKVTWTPAEIEATPTYSIDNKEVATVSDKGVVTAVAEGKATITITILDKKLTCPVDVLAPVKNEFPLLKYNIFNDKEDKEVTEYEKKFGREYGKILYGGHEFYGYQNKELDLITGAIYGLNLKSGQQVIIALSKENIKSFPKTRILLKEYGFSNIEMDIDEDGNQIFHGKHDTDPNLSVKGWNSPVSKLASTLAVWFVREPEQTNPKAKDFPGWEAFQTRNVVEIKKFEEKLGFRAFVPELQEGANLPFQTKSEKLSESNLIGVFYFNKPQEGKGSFRFINCILSRVYSAKDINTKAFKEWLETNGFGYDYSIDVKEGICEAYNADKSAQIYTIFDRKMGVWRLQIFDPKNKTQVLKLMEQPETAELIRRSVRTQNSFIPDFR